MTNPTLIGQDSAWRGFTFDQIVERVLQARGLTADTTTYPTRTEADASELELAQISVRRAFDLLNTDFPSVWSRRTYSVAWTSGDHSIALPANVMAIRGVTMGGYPLAPISLDDYYRLLKADSEGGGIASGDRPLYYRVSGYSDEDTGTAEGDRDWRLVLRLDPAPANAYATATLVVDYLAFAGDYEAVDSTEGGDPVALYPWMQGWVLERAKELMSAETGDSNLQKVSREERMIHEASINTWIEQATRDTSNQRMTWRYPNKRRRRRYR